MNNYNYGDGFSPNQDNNYYTQQNNQLNNPLNGNYNANQNQYQYNQYRSPHKAVNAVKHGIKHFHFSVLHSFFNGPQTDHSIYPASLRICALHILLKTQYFSIITFIPKFVKYYYDTCYNTITRVPIPIRIHPTRDFGVNLSCKNTKASTRVMTTLNLSMGTTLEASPICNAL